MGAQAAPRNVFCGHLIGALAGCLALVIFGLTTVPANLTDISAPRIGAVTLCLCLTLSLMVWLNVPHAPAGATTMIVGLGLMRTPFQLTVLMIAVVLLIVQGILINASIASGIISGAQGQTFTAGDLGKYTIGANGEILLGDPTVFNKDNIDHFNF